VKFLTRSVAVAVMIVSPIAAFAQSNDPITRAQVRAQLVQLEQQGYRVGDGDHANYPQLIQAAEAKIALQEVAANGAYGGVQNGGSDAGSWHDVRATAYSAPIYEHH
jgi:hypothetical protein